MSNLIRSLNHGPFFGVGVDGGGGAGNSLSKEIGVGGCTAGAHSAQMSLKQYISNRPDPGPRPYFRGITLLVGSVT